MNNELEKIFQEVKQDKKFSLNHLKYLVEEFNDRFWKALQTFLSKGVKKYVFTPTKRIIWIVVGKRKDYLILSNLYCPCEDFYLSVVLRKTAKMCYHLLAKVLAEKLDYYEELTVEDERFDKLMKEWKEE